jgi:tetratricopeptide (TPR) repeat protein
MRILDHFLERRALNAFATQDYAKAQEFFEELLEKTRHWGYLRDLGLICMARKDFAGAEKYLLQELEYLGNSFSRFCALGDLYYMWGKSEKAITYYGKAGNFAKEQGYSVDISQDIQEADLTLIKKRIEICRSPEAFARTRTSQAHLEEGNRLMNEKQYEQAYETFAQAVDADPTCYPALNNMGVIAQNYRKDYADSVARFKSVCEISSNPQMRRNLAAAEKSLEEESKK